MEHSDERETGVASRAGSPGSESPPSPVPDAASDMHTFRDDMDFDPGLARLLEEVTRRIEAGEHIDTAELAAEHPVWSDQIQRLIPAIAELATFSTSDGEVEVHLDPSDVAIGADIRRIQDRARSRTWRYGHCL